MNQLIAMNAEITMSSREIAELIGSRHSNLVRSIERLIKSSVIEPPPVEFFEEINNLGFSVKRPMYVFSGVIGKRDSIVVIAQNSPEFTATLVDRWQELEAQVKQQVPQTYAAALLEAGRLAMELEQSQQQLAIAAPKADFVDRYMSAPETFGFRQVAKKLHMKENELRDFLLDNRVMYYLSGRLTAYANHVDAGRFEQVSGVAGNDHAYTQSKFTTKGVEWLAGEIAKSKLK